MDEDLLAAFGEAVFLMEGEGAERDAMNRPVAGEERSIEVSGVLVNFDARPAGQRTDAVLCFPAGFERDVRGMDVLVRGLRYRVEWCRPAPEANVVPYGITAGAVRVDG